MVYFYNKDKLIIRYYWLMRNPHFSLIEKDEGGGGSTSFAPYPGIPLFEEVILWFYTS